MFQRMWSQADEIVLLDSVITFERNPLREMAAFHDLVRPLIQVEVTNSQLDTKIRNMRMKFLRKAHKSVVSFSKLHDRTCFEKSQAIWGPNGILPVERKVKDKDKKPVVLVTGKDEWFEGEEAEDGREV
ncbi:hypothetical protein AALP_AA6G008400 [Arabis alpina]|uniref:Glabrous enhancer-binding protein-like DBD domain-containing protein n=1 Tax=Arabis alpina TaxID=50452 RepID=A0A087GL89_ARAAL|nr:hypothetical protein AALP_AA6G008400 [Arabis alpina]